MVIGYSYTPNWAADRNAHDKHDFYVRRSFSGGEKWTIDPYSDGIRHEDTFKIYDDELLDETGHVSLESIAADFSQYAEIDLITEELFSDTDLDDDGSKRNRVTVVTTYGPGEFEPAMNVSKLRNNKSTVIEPRIVSAPGTVKDPSTGKWTVFAEDKQNPNVLAGRR